MSKMIVQKNPLVGSFEFGLSFAILTVGFDSLIFNPCHNQSHNSKSFMIKKILILGVQGSGKGTQAELLSVMLNIPSIDMGQLIRNEISTGSELGLRMHTLIANGNLISDLDALFLLKERLSKSDIKNGYILDGFPRDRSQYEVFFDRPTHVIVLSIPREESIRRLANRLTCNKTGKVYSTTQGYKVGDVCPEGGVLFVREDDTGAAIERRLNIYEERTKPLIEAYEKEGIVSYVDGTGNPKEVHGRVKKIFS